MADGGGRHWPIGYPRGEGKATAGVANLFPSFAHYGINGDGRTGLRQGQELLLWLPAFDGAKYRLYKSTWEFKLLHQERAHLGQNFELIKETLLNPKLVRQSERDADCFLAYKEFGQYILGEGRQGNVVCDTYIAVVVDKAKGRIATFYPCEKPKHGKTIWPKAQK